MVACEYVCVRRQPLMAVSVYYMKMRTRLPKVGM